MKKFLSNMLKSDAEKERERKQQQQNPHHVKSKRHWDWDTGYSDMEIMQTSDDEIVKGKKMKDKFIPAFMDVAERFAQLSSAKRAQVGAIVVKDNRIISIGYNGMPSGWDNDCEMPVYPTRKQLDFMPTETLAEKFPFRDDQGEAYRLMTKPEVLHAESNALAKLARCTESALDATLFVTHEPCIDCAKMIYQAGINTVYFKHEYRSAKGSGADFLTKSGVKVIHVKRN